MNNFVFSPSESRFYAIEWRDDYIDNNCWPGDAVNVSDNIYYEFSGTPPTGKQLVTVNNLPSWGDIPPLSYDEELKIAKQKKSALLADAQRTVSLWQTELQLGIISDDDKASLIAWMKHIQALNAVDTSTAPDIEWPVKPE